MPSPVDRLPLRDAPRPRPAETFFVWNRRLHYYLGLYLLLACWLFALTGILLNHPTWEFAQFWPNRVQTRTERTFTVPEGATDLDRVRHLMQQLGLVGEVQWPTTRVAGDTSAFQVNRPGLAIEVKADLAAKRATVQQHAYNVWGLAHTLHTFGGVRANDRVNVRDWSLTTIWVLAMDALAVGLVLMVASSYVMWYRLKAKRRGGVIALVLGVASCGWFVVGVRWLT